VEVIQQEERLMFPVVVVALQQQRETKMVDKGFQ
jgi:hypothetical protein